MLTYADIARVVGLTQQGALHRCETTVNKLKRYVGAGLEEYLHYIQVPYIP
jgi:hypothetical protein